MQHLILATRNAHKVREFAELLGEDFVLEDLSAHPEIPEVTESGITFEENARIKAVAVSRQLSGLVLADDSGLEADSLGGAPGIFSARYAGPGKDDAANRRKLLREMARVPAEAVRTARFRCLLVLARNGQMLATCEGTAEGEVVRAERGGSGFGYDSLFRPTGIEKTFGELSANEKNRLSHRAAAIEKLRHYLKTARLSR